MTIDFVPLGTHDEFIETRTVVPMLDAVARKSGEPSLASGSLASWKARTATIDTMFLHRPSEMIEAIGCLVCSLHTDYLFVSAMYVAPHRMTDDLLADIQRRVEYHARRFGYSRIRMQTARAGDEWAMDMGYRKAALVYEKRLETTSNHASLRDGRSDTIDV